MPRENMAKRIASDVCLTMESYLGLTADCRFLEPMMENAIHQCLNDGCAVTGPTVDVDPEHLLALRIRRAIESALASYKMEIAWTSRLGAEVEGMIEESVRESSSLVPH